MHLEHAVLERRLHVLLGHALRKADGAREGAEAALEPEVAAFLDLVLPLALGRDGERVVGQLDGDLVLGDAGEVERVDDLVLGLPDVRGRDPALRRAAVSFEEPVHEPAHLVLERGELAKRLPPNQRCHASSFESVSTCC